MTVAAHQGSAPGDHPLVSVITVCRDAQDGIGPTIASVLAQSYPRVEQIIIDGASTDGTMGVIERARDGPGGRIARVVSEPDTGVYHAMNKGIALASGGLMLFLNAGDTLLHPRAISSALGAIGRAPAGDVYHAGVVWFDPGTGRSTTRRVARVTRCGLYRGSLPHQGMFFRADAFARVGVYDESFRIAGDYEWCLRAFFRHSRAFVPIDALISVYPEGGLSSGDRDNGTVLRAESDRAREMHFGPGDAARCRAWIKTRKMLGI